MGGGVVIRISSFTPSLYRRDPSCRRAVVVQRSLPQSSIKNPQSLNPSSFSVLSVLSVVQKNISPYPSPCYDPSPYLPEPHMSLDPTLNKSATTADPTSHDIWRVFRIM